MFFEQIATLTRDHHRTHIADYLARVNDLHTEKVPLILPRSYEVSSIVGGVVGVSRETLPAYAIDAYDKQPSPTNENLGTYLYIGQISGLCGARTGKAVEQLAKRHGAAAELFIREHLFLTDLPVTADFEIIGFAFARTEFFGAAQLEMDGKPYWIDGFRMELHWLVSEDEAKQHE